MWVKVFGGNGPPKFQSAQFIARKKIFEQNVFGLLFLKNYFNQNLIHVMDFFFFFNNKDNDKLIKADFR